MSNLIPSTGSTVSSQTYQKGAPASNTPTLNTPQALTSIKPSNSPLKGIPQLKNKKWSEIKLRNAPLLVILTIIAIYVFIKHLLFGLSKAEQERKELVSAVASHINRIKRQTTLQTPSHRSSELISSFTQSDKQILSLIVQLSKKGGQLLPRELEAVRLLTSNFRTFLQQFPAAYDFLLLSQKEKEMQLIARIYTVAQGRMVTQLKELENDCRAFVDFRSHQELQMKNEHESRLLALKGYLLTKKSALEVKKRDLERATIEFESQKRQQETESMYAWNTLENYKKQLVMNKKKAYAQVVTETQELRIGLKDTRAIRSNEEELTDMACAVLECSLRFNGLAELVYSNNPLFLSGQSDLERSIYAVYDCPTNRLRELREKIERMKLCSVRLVSTIKRNLPELERAVKRL